MSREIKFRIYDTDEKEMFYQEDIDYIDFFTGIVFIREEDGYDYLIDSRSDGKLMQYTGLKDKNGKEIYERDILSIKIYSGDKVIAEGKTVVEFKDGCFGVIWGHDKAFLSLNSFFKAKFEVIGNIYENPELLEGER
ncbi:YopX family protein [Clostridium perfringens]|uniref:YopX family protein n=1 Tax=Clostridium perfringens TaxID=1502 RepID=UPI00224716C0|nr:YopX family protein [Clostridium perfringens]MCX0390755.1 YopX family protein [Clostridium perfringens]